MSNPVLILIDGHSLAFRAFHALPPDLSAPGGELTNATYGFTMMLLNVLKEWQPEYVAVAFDVGKTFRHDMYPAYKAHRERMPEELKLQVERIKEILGALQIPIVTAEGYEADDVLGTLACQAEVQCVNSAIVTGDRDIVQLVDKHISVVTSGRRFSDTIVYTPDVVLAHYGLRPNQMVDLKALLGDKSDNIPGVRGVGEKGATSLLQRYGTLDNVYAHLEEIAPARLHTALETGRESALLSQRLGQIVTEAPVQLDLNACRRGAYERERVVELFRRLAFRTFLDRLPDQVTVPSAPQTPASAVESDATEQQMSLFNSEEQRPTSEACPETRRETAPAASGATGRIRLGDGEPEPSWLITDSDALREVAAKLAVAPRIAFDTETTGLDPHAAALVGMSLAWGTDASQAAYFPVRHPEPSPVSWDEMRLALAPVFADGSITKIAHNAVFDLEILSRHGLDVRGDLVDTMIAEWLLDPSTRALGLKDLAFTRLETEMSPISELIGAGKTQISMDQVPVAQAARYATADAYMTMRLADVQLPLLAERGLTSLFRDVEMPLVPVLLAMERAGVRVDVRFLREMSHKLTAEMRRLEREICLIAGYAFNVNSTQQLSDVLFGKLGLPATGLKRTMAGSYSTAADVLEGLRGRHEIIGLILEQRVLSKLVSTYCNALPDLVSPVTGRLHTSFNQTGAETGRISSSAPNLQNIPIRTEAGREIRRAFVADPSCQLLSADYSQVELRILAHVSQDQNLLAAFARGEDIHASAAAAVYGVPLGQVSKDQRGVAKMMNFATSYGVSAYGLSQRTGLPRADAEQFMERYFSTYPGVLRYLEQTKAMARECGYVETLLGRRRYFPILRTTATGSKAYQARQAAERAAINHPIQGAAADIIKIAMNRLYRALQEGGYRARLLLQVHDELVLEVPDAEMGEVGPLVKDTMEHAYLLTSRLKVDAEAGPNWLELTPLA